MEKPRRIPAFTLIEVLIVITIMALISMTMALSFSGARGRALFNEAQIEMLDLMQKARGSALSSVLVEDPDGVADSEPVAYYKLSIQTNAITLTAVSTSFAAEIESLSFENGITLSPVIEVYYFPPYGEVCFDVACADKTTQYKDFTLQDATGEDVTYRISRHGGHPEKL